MYTARRRSRGSPARQPHAHLWVGTAEGGTALSQRGGDCVPTNWAQKVFAGGSRSAHAVAALDLHKQRVVGRQQQGALEVQVEAVLHVGLQLWGKQQQFEFWFS